jgi:HSP20 family protein
MVEPVFGIDASRPGWRVIEETQYLNPEGVHWRIAVRSHAWRPPTDVYETEEAMVVRVEIAGMRETDFTISLEERTLQIRGVRSDTSERQAFHQMEIAFGEFSTEVELPSPVVVDQIEASYRDGFLHITLPKARPQQIRVG